MNRPPFLCSNWTIREINWFPQNIENAAEGIGTNGNRYRRSGVCHRGSSGHSIRHCHGDGSDTIFTKMLFDFGNNCRLVPSIYFNGVMNCRQVPAFKLNINGRSHSVDIEPETPLLWVLRDTIGLTGTKYGCGISQCGACTVHVNGRAVRSCVTPASPVIGKKITTIEGLSEDSSHPVQQAWIEVDVPQCGYCQTGMIMATAALLERNSKPSDRDIDRTITNICRCGTYNQVREAIYRAAKIKEGA